MIGDTEHDFEAAQAMKMDCYLIAGGHQPKEKLLATGAPVFDSLREAYAYWVERGII
jgi:phosphoglycolate phosphatase-like HAD superfamily hydrolase